MFTQVADLPNSTLDILVASKTAQIYTKFLDLLGLNEGKNSGLHFYIQEGEEQNEWWHEPTTEGDSSFRQLAISELVHFNLYLTLISGF